MSSCSSELRGPSLLLKHPLKNRDYQNLDTDNLIEELEAMGRSEKRAVESNLRILLMHLLKHRYQPDKCTNSWRSTIREHRLRWSKAFRDSPSLKNYYWKCFDECYQDAKRLAADESGVAIATFPAECPFNPNQVLDSECLPE
ncbi:MAG: DUF29 domain-containing protein [Cyanobacteria bacterium QH_9_48_43]|nr:MAG: DUF29 domain-containing protein [Cyanobacteria bacterium QH_9_48_43]PSO92702.1 MAG: DUF29 domain-containing protein [Cyanobacteria bacterium SW_6_48_11]PSP06469.1 MAG: DUF29 domain-containing protein [Cyanobacteria bacterium SW_7_48_12]PSP11735.1 MAG: DUF29 domain-containing protein [Cyanobacteria bacterium SW_10_48_33]PSP20426.1 MAG: DUF29 domain-containing protein [Cyanobacteria bacterium SW_5_48_44]PSP24761.1 MAG: DUF29 domain-containing protein [Cyanobacteria bacterium SW_8_48_13]